MTHRVTLRGRFWRKVERGAECWLWTGAKRPDGGGVVSIRKQPRAAHRVAWELTYGAPPARRPILHKCGNNGCVRPEHLALAPE